jgi:hypothetical protein
VTNKLLEAAAADTNKEVDGVAAVYSPNGTQKFHLTLARAGGSNNAYHKALADATKDYRRSGVDMFAIDFTEQRKVTASVLAATVIKGWNQEDFGIEFSIEAATEMLIAVPSFLDFVQTEASRDATYRKAGVERSAGN